ncbi:MAG: STAS domain-containing protein [Planctomycetota bacterium]
MQITLLGIEKNGVVKVATQGNITAAEINSAGPNPLQTTLGPTWSTMKVLMNMEGTSYIDSSAIGWLIGTSKELKTAGGMLILYGVQPGVKQVLDLLKVGRVVPIVDDESAAIELTQTDEL